MDSINSILPKTPPAGPPPILAKIVKHIKIRKLNYECTKREFEKLLDGRYVGNIGKFEKIISLVLRLNLPSKQLRSLFRFFSTEGKLDFKQFIKVLFGKSGANTPLQRPKNDNDAENNLQPQQKKKIVRSKKQILPQGRKNISVKSSFSKIKSSVKKIKQLLNRKRSSLRNIFQGIAQNSRKQNISLEDLCKAVEKLNLSFSGDAIKYFFEEIDSNKDGLITFTELANTIRPNDSAEFDDWTYENYSSKSKKIADFAEKRNQIKSAPELLRLVQEKVKAGNRTAVKAFQQLTQRISNQSHGSNRTTIGIQDLKDILKKLNLVAKDNVIIEMFNLVNPKEHGRLELTDFCRACFYRNESIFADHKSSKVHDHNDNEKRAMRKRGKNEHHEAVQIRLGPSTFSKSGITDPIAKLKSIFYKRGSTLSKAFQLFKIHCHRNVNQIDLDGFCNALEKLGAPVSEKQALQIFRVMDTNNSGTIDFEEFVASLSSSANADITFHDWNVSMGKALAEKKSLWVAKSSFIKDAVKLRRSLHKYFASRAGMLKAFQSFRNNCGIGRNGEIDSESFVKALPNWNINCDTKCAFQLFNALDQNKNGKIEYNEFAEAFFSNKITDDDIRRASNSMNQLSTSKNKLLLKTNSGKKFSLPRLKVAQKKQRKSHRKIKATVLVLESPGMGKTFSKADRRRNAILQAAQASSQRKSKILLRKLNENIGQEEILDIHHRINPHHNPHTYSVDKSNRRRGKKLSKKGYRRRDFGIAIYQHQMRTFK